MKVYDDFSQVGVQGPIISQVWAATASEMPFAPSSQDKAALQAANPLQQIMDKISSLLKELDRIILQNPKVSLSTLPPNHEIVTLVRQIIVAATQFTVRDELAVWFAQKLVNLLYASEIVLAIEIYIILLEKICELSKLVSKEFTTWLLYSDDQVSYYIAFNLNSFSPICIAQAKYCRYQRIDSIRFVECGRVGFIFG